MHLSPEDLDLFYRLHWALLAYANRSARVVPGHLSPEDIRQRSKREIAQLRDAWQQTPKILEEFLAENPAGLSADELAIAASWRHRVSDDFYIVRYLKPYAVFMSQEETPHLYGVLSLQDPIQTLTRSAPLPLMVRATLLPFRGRIIYDGLLGFYSITFGPGIRSRLNEEYSRLKEREGIIEQLVGPDGQPEIRTTLSRRAPRKPAPDWRPVLAEIATRASKIRRTDTQLQGAAVALLRAAVSLCQATFDEEDAEGSAFDGLSAVRRAATRVAKALCRDEEW